MATLLKHAKSLLKKVIAQPGGFGEGAMMRKHQQSIQALASLDVDKYVRKAAGKCEENVKIKIVIPLLQLLGYDPQDMEFEHHIEKKRADIALVFDNKTKLLVETKDLDESLDNHVDQGLNYAMQEGVEWVMLTNGMETVPLSL